MEDNANKVIWIKGLWHQGIVACAVWAELGFDVYGICDDREESNKLSNSLLPIYEPGLNELISRGINHGNLHFETTNSELPNPKYICLMHDTEVDDFDEVNISNFLKDFEKLAPYITPSTEVLITAQVPAGTCEELKSKITEISGFESRLSYMPENLKLGQAIKRFRNPPLPVAGISTEESISNILSLFPEVAHFEVCTLTEAEILKSTMNTLLAISVAYGNEISEICDQYGADGSKVIRLLQLEPRVGNKLPLAPGMPFSGGTLGRDVKNLSRLLSKESPRIINSIWESNQSRGEYLIALIGRIASNRGYSRIGLLGLTYKPNTSTLRRSFPLSIFNSLISDFPNIFGFDPKMSLFLDQLPLGLKTINSLEDIVNESNLIVISTPWLEILEYLQNNKISNKIIVDPYGALKDTYEGEPNYYHFGGKRSF